MGGASGSKKHRSHYAHGWRCMGQIGRDPATDVSYWETLLRRSAASGWGGRTGFRLGGWSAALGESVR